MVLITKWPYFGGWSLSKGFTVVLVNKVQSYILFEFKPLPLDL